MTNFIEGAIIGLIVWCCIYGFVHSFAKDEASKKSLNEGGKRG